MDDTTIASQEDLEWFATRDPAERQLTEPLKGVLAETALTGKNRYPFSLVKPVVELLLEQTLREYERAEATEGEGPAPPVLDGESLPETLSRFRTLLQGFTKAPWTIQRLCEILLNPTRQYRKLHKLALAIEKCLMVTGEVGVTPRMPPPPRLSALQHVNDNSKCHDPQPAPHAPDRSRRASSPSGGMQDPDAEDSAAFTSALIDVRGVPPSALHSASTSSNGPHHGPHHTQQHHTQQQQQQQQPGHAAMNTANNGHHASQFAQFHSAQQHAQHAQHGHGHSNHAGMEVEDERWPSGQAGQGQHTFLASMLGHQHQHHASHEGAHSPHAAAAPPPQQQQQQQQNDSSQGAPGKPAEEAAASAVAAAAAAVVGESMEVETPLGVSAAPQQQQQQQQQEGAAVAAAEAAARAVVEGLGGVVDASTSSGGAATDAGGAGAGAGAAGSESGGSMGSPAAAVPGEGPREGSMDRVPQTPPGKPLHERMDEH